MELAQLIAGLSKPSAYAFPVEQVTVRQTHMSVVFLVGDFAYKIKKPVTFAFVDFSSLQQRRRYCDEEVRLNRRLAPSVYLDVVPIACRDGLPVMEGEGEPVEWAVKMRRLPDAAKLKSRLQCGEVEAPAISALAKRIAAFHAQAESGPAIAVDGRFDVVAANARDNLVAAKPNVGTTITASVLARLAALTEGLLQNLQPLIEARADLGVPRDTHGDLRLDHVYLFPESTPPDDLLIIDCIEFSERLRFADPIADMAFLAMDFAYAGRRDLARSFTDAYFAASGDAEGRRLLPFYTAYRAAVRAKVESLKLAEPEVPPAERQEALQVAKAHWLLSLGAIEAPARRPCLVVVGGLPGSGKSTLARNLADRANFAVIRSDVVRKELSAAPPGADAKVSYTAEWNDRTYAECLRRAEAMLFDGNRVLIDANFREDRHRQAFLAAARRWAAPFVFLACKVDADTARSRLQDRRGDASDADWHVYEHVAPQWEPFSAPLTPLVREINTGDTPEEAVQRGLTALQECGLM